MCSEEKIVLSGSLPRCQNRLFCFAIVCFRAEPVENREGHMGRLKGESYTNRLNKGSCVCVERKTILCYPKPQICLHQIIGNLGAGPVGAKERAIRERCRF